ncbi:MAG: NADH-quinone oxidoreductase subunit J [Planctomycetota bacterium]
MAGKAGASEGALEAIINPLLLYGGCALGAVGVAFALPKRGASLAVIGGIIAAAAAGLVVMGLTFAALPSEGLGEGGLLEGNFGALPNIYFHVFGVLALASGLRMITHPRPVYAALYFILTIVASSGLYVLLSAEFMAFALIIIYAGAILITYLFVIMLATQAPSEEEPDRLSEYDAVAREPVAAAAVGFVLLAVITTLMFSGLPTLERSRSEASPEPALELFHGKWEPDLTESLRAAELIDITETIAIDSGLAELDLSAAPVTVLVTSPVGDSRRVEIPMELIPEGFVATNVERVGMNLLAEHPMTIEIAGVILLMAMLGATVLARKQVDIEEAEKERQARRLGLLEEGA